MRMNARRFRAASAMGLAVLPIGGIPCRASNARSEFRFLAEPTDVNFGGKVHGGMVMKWIDQARLCGCGRLEQQVLRDGRRGRHQFVAPIRIGGRVRVRCKLVHTGTSSMHFAVGGRCAGPEDRQRTDGDELRDLLRGLDTPDGRSQRRLAWSSSGQRGSSPGGIRAASVRLSRRWSPEVARFRPDAASAER